MKSAVALLTAMVVVGLLAVPAGAAAPSPPRLDVLSNRADLVSGGDALVQAVIPASSNVRDLRVSLNGKDVSSAFARGSDGRALGLVKGLKVGANALSARLGSSSTTTVAIENHPTGGPVFSGPQVQPWKCQEGATDKQCNQPATYEYRYKSSDSGQLQSYDPDNPPSDVATTTTDQGQTVPYIVRVETGYQDRDQYRIAVLYDPSKPFTARSPQKGFNHKLLINHGASCGIERQSGEAPDVLNDAALSRGFAVMSTALNNAGHNCNLVTQAESMVMAKEHLVETYGDLRYTIGTGCSGGSLTQQQVANAFPGIYQGILPACSFPDAWSTGQQLVDYHLVRQYLENPAKWGTGVVWSPADIAAVEGHPNHVNSVVFDTVYWTSLGAPDDGCPGVDSADNYNAESNPGGVRCTLADYMVNVFAPRPKGVWIEAEKKVGRGFAGLPLDNVGVQYGLKALEKGQLTPEQFTDLNAKIGGGSIDSVPTAERLTADQPALRNVYLSGGVNSANNLDRVAIIDLRGPDPGAFHDAYRSWATRARLEKQQGRFPRNQVIWFGQVPLMGDTGYATDGLLAMDRWLGTVEKDKSSASLADKIAKDRPADVNDRCSQVAGVEQVSVPGVGKVCELEQVQTRFGTPRTVAGESVATDTNKCTLKPLRQADYYPVTFNADQWARLQKAFPGGVCDWSKPGVDQRDTVPWRTYQDAAGKVVYGGRALGAAPGGSGAGWTSESFSSWRK